MSFEDFFQAEILSWSAACLQLAKFDSFPHECTNFPLGDSRDINYHLLVILSLLSQLETPLSLAADYSNYPRIVGGRTNLLVYPPFSCLQCQNNAPLQTPKLILPAMQAIQAPAPFCVMLTDFFFRPAPLGCLFTG